jgi:hypothetical protein
VFTSTWNGIKDLTVWTWNLTVAISKWFYTWFIYWPFMVTIYYPVYYTYRIFIYWPAVITWWIIDFFWIWNNVWAWFFPSEE